MIARSPFVLGLGKCSARFRFRFVSTSLPRTLQIRGEARRQLSSNRPIANKKPPSFLGLLGVFLAATGIFYLGVRVLDKNNVRDPSKREVEDPSVKKKTLQQSSAEKRAFAPGQVSVIFVLGGPGAGKGTQCGNLVRDYGFIHLSAGDLLRAEQKRPDSTYGSLIATYIKEGKIVPQEITIALLRQAMEDGYAKGHTRFLIDGFPRQMDQALTFEEQVSEGKAVLFFDCPEEVMLKRLLKRGETSGRSDDNAESIKKRFRTFKETSMPVVNYYAALKKVIHVNCDKPPTTVYQEVQKALAPIINSTEEKIPSK